MAFNHSQFLLPWLPGFIKYNKRWSLQGLSYGALTIYLTITTFSEQYDKTSLLFYALARACGSPLKLVLVPSFIPPICRVIYTEARHSSIGKILGLNRRILDHQILATVATIVAVIHTAAHLLNNSSVLKSQPGISGLVMLFAFVIPLAGVVLLRRYTKLVSKYSYSSQVLRPHQLGAILFISAYGWHTPDFRLLPFAISMILTYFIDQSLEDKYYRFKTTIHRIELVEQTDYVNLVVVKPEGFKNPLPGQYARLTFPQIDSPFEAYHPFTICDMTNEHITFLIKCCGTWTEKLKQYASTETGKDVSIYIRGPFGGELREFSERSEQRVTVVCSSSGIALCLSYINLSKFKPKMQIHQIERSVQHFIPLVNAISDLEDIKLNLYLTSTGKSVQLPGYPNITIMIGRPNIRDIIENADVLATCGNPKLVSEVEKTAYQFGKMCYVETN